jgi:hypothetical protein
MNINPQSVAIAALVAFIITGGAVAVALRGANRPLVPSHIWDEVVNAQLVRVYCRHCTKSAAVIMPIPCEGAMVIREIFAGQHANCVPQPVTFV